MGDNTAFQGEFDRYMGVAVYNQQAILSFLCPRRRSSAETFNKLDTEPVIGRDIVRVGIYPTLSIIRRVLV